MLQESVWMVFTIICQLLLVGPSLSPLANVYKLYCWEYTGCSCGFTLKTYLFSVFESSECPERLAARVSGFCRCHSAISTSILQTSW